MTSISTTSCSRRRRGWRFDDDHDHNGSASGTKELMAAGEARPEERTLLLSEIKAFGVPDADEKKGSGVSDPFVKFKLVGEEDMRVGQNQVVGQDCRTSHKNNETDPVFPEKLWLHLPQFCSGKLQVEVWDHDFNSGDELLAVAIVELQLPKTRDELDEDGDGLVDLREETPIHHVEIDAAGVGRFSHLSVGVSLVYATPGAAQLAAYISNYIRLRSMKSAQTSAHSTPPRARVLFASPPPAPSSPQRAPATSAARRASSRSFASVWPSAAARGLDTDAADAEPAAASCSVRTRAASQNCTARTDRPTASTPTVHGDQSDFGPAGGCRGGAAAVRVRTRRWAAGRSPLQPVAAAPPRRRRRRPRRRALARARRRSPLALACGRPLPLAAAPLPPQPLAQDSSPASEASPSSTTPRWPRSSPRSSTAPAASRGKGRRAAAAAAAADEPAASRPPLSAPVSSPQRLDRGDDTTRRPRRCAARARWYPSSCGPTTTWRVPPLLPSLGALRLAAADARGALVPARARGGGGAPRRRRVPSTWRARGAAAFHLRAFSLAASLARALAARSGGDSRRTRRRPRPHPAAAAACAGLSDLGFACSSAARSLCG